MIKLEKILISPSILFYFRFYLVVLTISLTIATELFAQDSLAKAPIDYLRPVDTQNPQATLGSFMKTMNAYRRAILSKEGGTFVGSVTASEQAQNQLGMAVRTLDLSELPALLREQKGKEAAIYLKEVIDRIVILDHIQVPGKKFASQEKVLWRLADSEIVMKRVSSGQRAGEYLFSSDTVNRAREFYEKVKHLPYIVTENPGSGYREPWIEKNLPQWTKKHFLSLSSWQWLGLFFVILIGLFFKIIIHFSLSTFFSIVSKSELPQKSFFLNLQTIIKPIGYLAAVGIWFLSLFVLQLQGTPLSIITVILKIMLSILLIWLAYRIVDHCTRYLRHLAFTTDSKLDDQLVPLLSRTFKIITLIAGILLAVQNLGVNVVSLLAGLGLGGLAFALAARDTVANFFGSLMIIFDRPFQIGDWIKVGEAEGLVEDLGFRSTRIRTFYNSVISIPNSEIAACQIDNMGARKYRRVLAKLSVTYDTSPEKMEAFLEGIKDIIKAHGCTRKDYYHVVFENYGDSGLIVMVYFFLKVPDWSAELVERQNIYLKIYRLAKDLGIEFAFPTRTLHIENSPEKEELPFGKND